jgi:hypothetical protein
MAETCRSGTFVTRLSLISSSFASLFKSRGHADQIGQALSHCKRSSSVCPDRAVYHPAIYPQAATASAECRAAGNHCGNGAGELFIA